MKVLVYALILFLSKNVFSQTISFTSDTINRFGKDSLKEGYWIIFGKDRKYNACSKLSQKVEEGNYTLGKKNGVWKEYFCNGNLKNIITFVGGRPCGEAIMFFENGQVSEKGVYKNNRWVGKYELFFENGQVQHHFNFNEKGKREGEQTYYYPNGQIWMKGNYKDGQPEPYIKEYYEDGSEKPYNFDSFGQKIEPINKSKDVPSDNLELQKENNGPMVLDGKHTLYNSHRNITKDGFFKNNIFIDGKAYFYNEKNELTRTAIYKNGLYVGDAPIEK